jgi:hypothetical protein
MRIQSVMFDRNKWTMADAKKWIRAHKKKIGRIDVTDRYLRFRQLAPAQFSFMRILSIGDGIKLIVGNVAR